MRRLVRWTFNALAAASLLLCMATAGLWVRSYWVPDQFYARRPDASGHGRVHYFEIRQAPITPSTSST